MNSNALTEAYFIAPLEAHYEAKAKPGVRLTILNELNGTDENTLVAAVNFIQRSRKAMSFPSPAECFAAVKATKTAPRAKAGEIDGKNYCAKAAEYAKASGRESFPVIARWVDKDAGTTTPEWDAWLGYWQDIGSHVTLAMVRDRESWTVPTTWPYEFDQNARWTVGDPVAERDAA